MAFKIYTKTGDAGETALFGGRRVAKSHLRVDAYGTIDELNAFTGLLIDHLPPLQDVRSLLIQVQHRLFTIGAHLASDPEKKLPTPDLAEEDLLVLEQAMDNMDAELPPLKNFILPGGSPVVSHAHVCRTVCRRAERLVVALHAHSEVDPLVLRYLNRLSDYFFVLSRYLAQQTNATEIIWQTRK
jgi:cob(I)alamin adenosyltransferase